MILPSSPATYFMSSKDIIKLFYITHPRSEKQVTYFQVISSIFTGLRKILLKDNMS